MKKLILLLAAGVIAQSVSAQTAEKSSTATASKRNMIQAATHKAPTSKHASLGRIASVPTCSVTETFGTGTYTTLPTGWTAGILNIGGTPALGTWSWTNGPIGSANEYSAHLGAMNSTTASDGWMLYDADSLGAVDGVYGTSTGRTTAGWLQSPTPGYDCSGFTSVRLNFQDYFEKFQDSTFVWVSTVNPPTWTAGTYSVYPVIANNSLADNVETPNAEEVHIDISTVAAGQSNVSLRFVYQGPAGGGYAWMIDDICLSELCTDDISSTSGFLFEPDASAYNSSLFYTPLEFVDSVYPVTLLSNEGATAETTVPLTAQIFKDGTSVYSVTSTYNSLSGYTSLANSAYDSVAQFGPYLPTATGTYLTTFSAPLAGDCDLTDNADSVGFVITDTIWMQNDTSALTGGGYYAYESGASPICYFQGTRFDVPSNAVGDTVTGFGVVFGDGTLPTGTGQVSVQLYSINQAASGWNYLASSYQRPLIAADISGSTAVWAYFRSNTSNATGSGGWGPFVLQPGTSYAAVVQLTRVTTDVVVEATEPPNATPYSGYFGQSDTSDNDGGTTFGATAATGNTSIPAVRMYFGNTSLLGVQNVSLSSKVGKPYPDPANTSVTIPFSLTQNADVTVTLTNMIGQVVATQVMGNITSGKAVFNTSSLPSGSYVYTLNANNQRSSIGQIIVAH